ncbi:MAG: PorT family protein [Altibacter sp.]|uniref:porin family protein n=1 Tax=Altibacter sp. TaxID=2024823 RepID=UPI001D3EA956|nr:porin family protein [Altibacter sp.]MBZ0326690.1 PorT family protein [Altibacter sp.]
MKKLILLAAIAVSTVSTSFAQGEVHFGAKAGVNVASIGGDAYLGGGFGSFGSRVSFHVGGLVEVPITEKISVQPEILYSSQGSNWDFTGAGDIQLDYVNFPIMGKYHIIEGLSGELGPVIGVLIKADQSGVDVKDSYKSTDIAIGIGATYRLPMGVFFSLRYNKGITDINDVSGYTYSNQNNVFQVSAGFSI